MKKRSLILSVYILCFIVILLNSVFFVKDQLFFDLDDLPTGELLYSDFSPSLTKTAICYRVSTSVGSGVRIEIVTHGENGQPDKVETFYWDTGKNTVVISWVDDNIITVDDVAFDLSNGDTYDCRRKTSFSQKW